MQRVLLIHGWTGGNNKDWFPWARKELQRRGYEVHAPEMPESDYPKIEPWVAKLKEVVGEPRPDDILIGHSMGCQGILRYLQTLSEETKIQKVVLIAGFEKLKEAAFEVPEDKVIFKPWSEAPIDYPKIKKMANSWIAVFSDDDPIVAYEENSKVFKENLGAEIIIKHKMGHFTADEGITEIPFLLELLK